MVVEVVVLLPEVGRGLGMVKMEVLSEKTEVVVEVAVEEV